MKQQTLNGMVVVHANDPTTKMLSRLYEMRTDLVSHVTETSSNSEVRHALKDAETVMMLGHGNPFGLFSTPDKKGQYVRFLVEGRHVEFLRGKTCVGIWCYANEFALHYGLHGLFSGMVISEQEEADAYHIVATKEEIDREIEKYASRLTWCLENCELRDIPARLQAMDDVRSSLTQFNYQNLYYYE